MKKVGKSEIMNEIKDYESIESLPAASTKEKKFLKYSGLNYELNSLFTLLEMQDCDSEPLSNPWQNQVDLDNLIYKIQSEIQKKYKGVQN